ncbi:hypothetical protein V495_08228, partial [Pseudogymnoascus sp. VKM F-4514 (FW-929)]
MVELYAAFTVLSMDTGTRDAIIITLAGILSHFVWYVVKQSWRACFENSASQTETQHFDIKNRKLNDEEPEVTEWKLKYNKQKDILENLRNERDMARDERDYAHKQRDDSFARGLDARISQAKACTERDMAHEDLFYARKQRDAAYKERDEFRKSKVESDEKYDELIVNLEKEHKTKIFLIKQRYDERIRKAIEQSTAAKAASLEGKCANCNGIGAGGNAVTTGYAKVTGDSQVEGEHENLQQLRDKARQEIGGVVDRSYELYSLMLRLDVYVEENKGLRVKQFEDLTELVEYVAPGSRTFLRYRKRVWHGQETTTPGLAPSTPTTPTTHSASTTPTASNPGSSQEGSG